MTNVEIWFTRYTYCYTDSYYINLPHLALYTSQYLRLRRNDFHTQVQYVQTLRHGFHSLLILYYNIVYCRIVYNTVTLYSTLHVCLYTGFSVCLIGDDLRTQRTCKKNKQKIIVPLKLFKDTIFATRINIILFCAHRRVQITRRVYNTTDMTYYYYYVAFQINENIL